LPGRIDGLTAGFPCFGTSAAGRRQGLQHVETGLIVHVFRSIDESQCEWVFLENVKNILSMPCTWEYILKNFHERGFSARWVTVEANQVGIPMRRARWFCFAARVADLRPWVDPLGANFQLERDLWVHASQRPQPRNWLVRLYEPNVAARLRMCGLAVVPMQAHLAARLLSSDMFPLVQT
jgi:site-specific DNA-cytosine methylase